ncbi:MAG: hypothetical protein JO354_10685 [Verrucomicrobia bacterium]|nr:hypothetical protein [Verrucomicrobiota bacterium]
MAVEVQRAVSLRPTAFERLLACLTAVLLLAVVAAVVRGRAEWQRIPALIWLHLATIILALALTPVLLLRPRGVRRHRQLGYVWVVSMTVTAALSFEIRTINPGGLSAIHILSAITLVSAPLVAWRAHNHRVVAHRFTVQILVTGALLVAGFFTFPFARLLGRWLFG